MRIAAIYDIHGNLPALEAVLQEIIFAEIDQIVVGGDVVSGPMPADTLDRLLSLTILVQFIRGNTDREVTEMTSDSARDAVPEEVREITRWVSQQLPVAYRQLLLEWPETVRVTVSGLGEVLFCHATPRSDTEIFTRLTPEVHLLPIFDDINAPVVICGHTHMQFDRTVGRTRVVNAGSVGMPYGEPGAYWLLLGPTVHFRHTPYDGAMAAERILSTDYPQAQDFAANNVLHPPSESEALEVFTRIEQAS